MNKISRCEIELIDVDHSLRPKDPMSNDSLINRSCVLMACVTGGKIVVLVLKRYLHHRSLRGRNARKPLHSSVEALTGRLTMSRIEVAYQRLRFASRRVPLSYAASVSSTDRHNRDMTTE